MTKKLKPVWCLNTGNGVPSDLHKKVASKGDTERDAIFSARNVNHRWDLSGKENDIYAYQTNRTKEAKFR